MSIMSYLRGSRIIAAWIQAGGAAVPQEQMEQRSDVCLKCPQNRRGRFMGVVGWIAVKLAELRSRVRIKNRLDAGLYNCNMCGCPLRLKTRMPIEEVVKGLDIIGGELAKFPHPCWVRSELIK